MYSVYVALPTGCVFIYRIKTDPWETVFSQNEKSPQKGRKYLQMSDQQGINLQNMQQLMKLNIKKKN